MSAPNQPNPSDASSDQSVTPINVFVAAAARQAEEMARTQSAHPQTPDQQSWLSLPSNSGIASPSVSATETPSVVEENKSSSLAEKILFGDTGDGVNQTRYHRFPLPGPLREYTPEYEKGKYLVPSVTGESMFDTYDRATTVAKSVDDVEALNRWKIRQVLKGVKDSPELLTDLDAEDESWWGKKKIDRMGEAAEVLAGSRRASEFGDCIHAWTAAVELGLVRFSDVPTEAQPYVEVYFRAMAEHGVSTVDRMVERVIYHPLTGACGTFDRIYMLADGTLVIGDLKTSSSIDLAWLSISIQLALYATSPALLPEDGKPPWVRMPELSQDTALVAHIPAKASPPVCELKAVDLRAGRFALEQAIILRGMRENAQKTIPSDLPKPKKV